jgi:hypothetical protein
VKKATTQAATKTKEAGNKKNCTIFAIQNLFPDNEYLIFLAATDAEKAVKKGVEKAKDKVIQPILPYSVFL